MDRKFHDPKYDTNIFEFVGADDTSDTYNKIVIRYFMSFCSNLNHDGLLVFQKCLELYLSMPPSVVGQRGCIWCTGLIIKWFENFYLVKIFNCIPGVGDELHFSPNNETADYICGSTDGTNDHHFSTFHAWSHPSGHQCVPYGISLLVISNDSHYECALLNYNSSSSFYPIGHPLPDFVYKVCKITPGKWNKITLQDVREHNEKVLKYY